MNFKFILVLLALALSVEAANTTNRSNKSNKTNTTNSTKVKEKAKPKWIQTPYVFKNNDISKKGTEYYKSEADLINAKTITSTDGTYGIIRRVKWCYNWWNTKIQWDLDNICTGRAIEKNITVGDTGLFTFYDEPTKAAPETPSDCVEIQLKRPGECIKEITFFT